MPARTAEILSPVWTVLPLNPNGPLPILPQVVTGELRRKSVLYMPPRLLKMVGAFVVILIT